MCFDRPQFIPEFTQKARRRIKELTGEMQAMPPAFCTAKEQWDAYRRVCSKIREALRDGVMGMGKSHKIVPDLTKAYRDYAKEIRTVSLQAVL